MDRPSIRVPDERAQLAAIACIAATVWVAFRIHTGIVLEDALITWRFAEHLTRGAGFTFNAGERVLGTTTPVLTVLLAAAATVTGTRALPIVAVSLMTACGAAGGWFTYRSLRVAGFSHAVALVATTTFLLHPDIVWSTVGGMETPLLLMLMSLSMYAALTGRYYVVAVTCAMLPFVRPEAVLWAILLVMHASWYGRQRANRPFAVAVVLSVAGALALTWYFGSPLPHSVTAKRAVGPGVGGGLTWYSVQQWFNWTFGASGVNMLGGRIERVAIAPWLLFVTLGATVVLRRATTRRLWPIVAFPPVLALAFLAGNAPHFLWYLVPFTACLCVLGGIGIGHLCEARWPQARPMGRAVILAMLVPVIAAFAHTMRSTTDWHWRNQRNEWQVRRAIGEWLRDNTSADSNVLMEAIGYQGTLSGRRVIDLAGLVTPRVVELQRESRTNAEAFAKILGEFTPDYVVLRTIEVDNNQHFYGGPLFATPEAAAAFRSSYRPVATYKAPYPELWHTGSSVTIYSRH